MKSKIKQHNTAGCFVVTEGEDKRLLLVHCIWQDGSEGYVPPKGHVEEDESPEEAAVREVKEETGYTDIDIVKHLRDVIFEYEDPSDGTRHVKTIKWYLAELRSDGKIEVNHTEREKQQIKGVSWIPLEQADKKIPFDAEREIVKDIIKYYDIKKKPPTKELK